MTALVSVMLRDVIKYDKYLLGDFNEGALSKSSVSIENLSCEFLEEQFRNIVNKQLNEIVHIKW